MPDTSPIDRPRRTPVTPAFIRKAAVAAAAALALTACSSGSSNRAGTTPTPPASYTIAGTITGLDSAGLVLQNNGADDLTVAANATSFEFADSVTAGGSYDVTVSAQPAGLACTVSNGTGTNISADVSNVSVSCSPVTYPVAGTVSGLGAATGLILQNNGGDDLSVPANVSSFQFATPVAAGGSYHVTVASQPAGLTCTVSDGVGTDLSAVVTDVSVTCDPVTYTVAGTVSGLSTNGLALQNNGGDTLAVNAGASTFQFATPIAAGAGYDITIQTQPTGLTCTVSNGSASSINADVTSVQITCSASLFTVGGSVSGLTGSGLVLQNNGADNLSVAANATAFEFSAPVAFGASSTVTVSSQPAGQICSVSNGSNVVNANVTNVAIDCADIITYTLTASAGANGAIAPAGSITINEGQSQGFTATPAAGWAINQWLVDGTPVQSGGSVYTLSNITANHAVSVTFAQATLTSSVASLALATSSSSRQITVTNTGSVAATNVTIDHPAWPAGTSASSTCGSTLAPGADCTITVTPGAAATSNCGTGVAPVNDAITVSADDASTTQIDVAVLTIGCIHQGGYLAVIDDTTPATGSIGGLIAARTDTGLPQEWGNLFMSTATSLTDGATNTAAIVSGMGSSTSYAARACADLTDSGYADWYLPAIDQLDRLYDNLSSSAVSGSLVAISYWSSTQTTPATAWVQSIGAPGDRLESSTFTLYAVRCARTIN